VRLCDVAPDGTSALVTRGVLNLTHARSHAEPEPLEPGRRFTTTVQLQSIAQAIEVGHRLRVSISTCYWPWLWPSPEPVTLTLFAGPASRLELPVRFPRAEDDALRPFEPPAAAPELPVEVLRWHAGERQLELDPASQFLRERHVPHDVHLRLPDGLELDWTGPDIYELAEGHPLSARIRCERRVVVRRGAWSTEVEIRSELRATATDFVVDVELVARHASETAADRRWRFELPRDLI